MAKTEDKSLKHQNKINFIIDELNNRPDAVDVICRMLDFEKRYILPVSIHFPGIERTLNIDEVLENWKSENPQALSEIELLWSKSELSTDRKGNKKECPNGFVIKNIRLSY